MRTIIVFVLLHSLSISTLLAQHPSAIADFESSDKGILIPRMTTVERQAIDSPAIGLLVF